VCARRPLEPPRPRYSPPVDGGDALEKGREFGWRVGERGRLDLGFSPIFLNGVSVSGATGSFQTRPQPRPPSWLVGS
jgi:hypothetical protein